MLTYREALQALGTGSRFSNILQALCEALQALSRQISVVPDLCWIGTRRLVESAGGVFDPVVNSAITVLLWPCRESGLDAAVSQRDTT